MREREKKEFRKKEGKKRKDGKNIRQKKERNQEEKEERKEDATCCSVLHSIRLPGGPAGRQPRAFTAGISGLYRRY